MAKFNASDIRITLSQTRKAKPAFADLGFGKYFSDHMFTAEYDTKNDWHNLQIQPYGPFAIEPGASVLHYGQSLFEGMKAFRQKDGSCVLFRTEYNWKRLAMGADRLCMMAPQKEIMTEGIKKLVEIDKDWIPTEKGGSLFIRPTLIGTESFLGVRPSEKYLFFVILSPVASYYSSAQAAERTVRIWIEETDLRAAPGGLGATKAGANYAASLRAAHEAKKMGYSQVLWLDNLHKNIEEVGTMNVFFVFDDEVVTPALNGSILAGGVRDSILTLLKTKPLQVSERTLSLDEVLEKHKAGRLKEVFGTGTAAVVSPVGELASKNHKIVINEGKVGTLSTELYHELCDIQAGIRPDTHGWIEKLF